MDGDAADGGADVDEDDDCDDVDEDVLLLIAAVF
jgi:hypothetical protein